ncbi:hypothetical protein LAV72_02250 [Lysinibacillus xylanilyticus]|uniref:hypothetical protein n=1 Tax=Lysinibacillus xylanilyticus TaxID=582475 RepID=UPI002B2518C9|nr:hypothetical protein [Lysinibacillus xylanilyticus]MEB2298449.1 hypothetical protein [Lysinibacillus xylanilyticus]
MGISDRGTKAKSITSCDNAFVTNIVLAQAAHRTPPGSSALRESEASAANVLPVRKRSVSNKCFTCAKAKRQQQSAQPERKSTHVMLMSPRLKRNKNSYHKSKAISIILLYYVKKRRSSENHENFII